MFQHRFIHTIWNENKNTKYLKIRNKLKHGEKNDKSYVDDSGM